MTDDQNSVVGTNGPAAVTFIQRDYGSRKNSIIGKGMRAEMEITRIVLATATKLNDHFRNKSLS